MKGLISGQMKRAIVRARRQLRGATSLQIREFGLNRYRMARKVAPIVISVKSRKALKVKGSKS